MKNIALSLLFISPVCFATDLIQSEFGSTYITPFASMTGIISTGNDFPNEDSSEGELEPFFGVIVDHQFSEHVAIQGYFNTDVPVDFLFVDISDHVTEGVKVGTRIGRVTIPSGMFTGYARAIDNMNFLPQATDPLRIGRAFYRFDGMSVYSTIEINHDVFLTVEGLYGDSNTDDGRTLLGYQTYAFYEYNTASVVSPEPVASLNLNLYVYEWQFLLNYTRFLVDIDLAYKGFPDFEMNTKDAETTSIRTGISYAFEKFDFVFSYFQTEYVVEPENVTTPSPEAPGKYQSHGASFLISYLHNYHWSWYGGIEHYWEENTDKYRQVLPTEAPKSIEYSTGLFLGNVYYIDHAFYFITEARVYEGSAVLVPDGRNPESLKDYWGVLSGSVVYKF